MFKKTDYVVRGVNFINNHLFPKQKKLSSLMLYATDLCDSACKHCLIWTKRPVTFLSFDAIKKIMSSRCVNANTSVGLEGGEFLLHPQYEQILQWFVENHPNFDLFSNCLRPEKLIKAVEKYPPHRLYISLDGDEDTYLHMRGKDGYESVLQVIESLKNKVPVFVMFTLSPYNDFDDLAHVAEICEQHKVFLRVGIYNNIPFFDTIDDAKGSFFGEHKNKDILSFSEARQLFQNKQQTSVESFDQVSIEPETREYVSEIPSSIKNFEENYDYVRLYQNWSSKKLRLKCNSILDSVIILPNGDVPICQNLDIKLGNIHDNDLDEVFNSEKSVKTQHFYSNNCNQCWVSYHRKYDIILYKNFERFFGKWATSKLLGYYKWDEDDSLTYKDVMK